MARFSPSEANPRAVARPSRTRPRLLTALLSLAYVGCGGTGTAPTPPGPDAAPGEAAAINLIDTTGLKLPPDFQPVALPLEKRKEIFAEAHRARVLATYEADQKLPMGESFLPKDDKIAFDKRVADSKAIHDEILAKKRDELAKRFQLSLEDLDKIEKEASLLHWLPPDVPNPFEATPKPAPE